MSVLDHDDVLFLHVFPSFFLEVIKTAPRIYWFYWFPQS